MSEIARKPLIGGGLREPVRFATLSETLPYYNFFIPRARDGIYIGKVLGSVANRTRPRKLLIIKGLEEGARRGTYTNCTDRAKCLREKGLRRGAPDVGGGRGRFRPLLLQSVPARLRKAGGLPLPAALRARGRHGLSPAGVDFSRHRRFAGAFAALFFGEGHLAVPPHLYQRRDRFVARALALMHAQPVYPWTVEALAREVGISRSGLAQRFTELVGLPPMQYLALWRLQLAARQLRLTDSSLASIAEAAGYESEASFNRAFKREFGKPPATWRRNTITIGAATRDKEPSGDSHPPASES